MPQPDPPSRALSGEAILYAFRELARRAGVEEGGPARTGFDGLGIACHYGQVSDFHGTEPALIVIPSDSDAWGRLIGIPDRSLESMPSADACPPGTRPPLEGRLPVLFRGKGPDARQGFARLAGNRLVVAVDVVAAALFLLTRWEESQISDRDDHGRMPGEKSVAFRQGFLDRPLVDEYALILRLWLRELVPGWTPRKRRFEIRLTHDVDTVRQFYSLAKGLRTAAGDLVLRRSAGAAMRSISQAVGQTLAPRKTESYRGLFQLADISRRHGLTSAFYFMASDYTPYDMGYDPASRTVREAIEWLDRAGCEIGFHPSYGTFDNPELLALEKSRLDAVLGRGTYGGRQHYLRFRAPDTWRLWEALGLSHDSTLSFAGHEGFRCGTCHPYRPFDLEADRELRVLEIPLIVMDGTLRQYRGLEPAGAEERAHELARRCRQVEGTFTLLWHNSSLGGDWSAWGRIYEPLVRRLTSLAEEAGVSAPGEAARSHSPIRCVG